MRQIQALTLLAQLQQRDEANPRRYLLALDVLNQAETDATQLNRLYSRYGSPSQLTDPFKAYKPFAANFEPHFAPEILKAYMQCVHCCLIWRSDPRQSD